MRTLKLLRAVTLSAVTLGSVNLLASCNRFIDYVSQVKLELDPVSVAANPEFDINTANFLDYGAGYVTVEQYVDGDTTYFMELDQRQVRTRYSNINTPESTAQIQKWGKSASIFTNSKLESAKEIILTNPTMDLRTPSTDSNGRWLCLVWYATEENAPLEDFRLLNLEIVQEGYSAVTGMEDTYPFYDIFIEAQSQAAEKRLNIHSPSETIDPNFYTGEATDITVYEFNQNAEKYEGTKVHITSAVVSHYLGVSSVWVEDLVPAGTIIDTDENGNDIVTTEDEVYGIYLFAGYDGSITPLYEVGNEISFTGVVTEFNGSYQITDLRWDRFDIDNPDNLELISKGNPVPSEGRVMTASEALTPGAVNPNTFVEISSVFTCYGGYGGTSEINENTQQPFENNAFTLFVKADDGTTTRVYIPDGATVKDPDNRNRPVTSYEFFVGKKFRITRGLVEEYQGHLNFEAPGGDIGARACIEFIEEEDPEPGTETNPEL